MPTTEEEQHQMNMETAAHEIVRAVAGDRVDFQLLMERPRIVAFLEKAAETIEKQKHEIRRLSGHYDDLSEECIRLMREHLAVAGIPMLAFADDMALLAAVRLIDAEDKVDVYTKAFEKIAAGGMTAKAVKELAKETLEYKPNRMEGKFKEFKL